MTAKSGIVSGSNPLCKSLMSENDLLMGVGLRLGGSAFFARLACARIHRI